MYPDRLHHVMMYCCVCREAVKPNYSSVFRLGNKCLTFVYVPKDPLHQVGYIALICLLYLYFYSFNTKLRTNTMGLFSNCSPQQELHPVNPPVGIYPNFTAKQPTMLTLREHAFSFSGVCHPSVSHRNLPWCILRDELTLRTISRSRTITDTR